MRKKDKLLIEIIKTVKLETPSVDFTENIMDYLKEEEQFLNYKSAFLHQELHENSIPSLPDEFVSRTMSVIENKDIMIPIYRPLIPKRTGIVIIVLFLTSFFFIDSSKENTSQLISPAETSSLLLEWLQESMIILPMLSISMLSIFLIVFIDFFVKKKVSF